MQIPTYKNEAFLNFSLEENSEKMKEALASAEAEFGKAYPLVIGGEEVFAERQIPSLNPANKSRVVGYSSAATAAHASQAIEAAKRAFETWRFVPAEERASYLFKAAAKIRERRFEFNAWMIHESGKNWREADADTAEAIDFLEYYARSMIDLAKPKALAAIQDSESPKFLPFPKEETRMVYIPLGVGVCIPPWNFPLAILAGMAASAVVAGNAVVIKPSELTGVIAYKFIKLMEEVGLPPGVMNLLTGYGAEIGDALVDSPDVRFVSFTGSKQIGCRIYERAAKKQPGQKWLKRVVAEMGGKDGVVVDETADLERAAQAIVDSAFGFQGQKCSAGSRAIVVDSVYGKVLSLAVEKAKKLLVGLPAENFPMGPVSDKKAFDKVKSYIEIGKGEGDLVLGGGASDETGYYIEPTIFANVERSARIFQEEIFGPVLSFTKAKDYKEAIALFNDTEYGLTGAFHSAKEERIQEALETMHCGNLYINKKCTGALVGVHPFGGFNMSGTDSKAGGPDYLLQFLQAKTLARVVE